MCVLPTGTLQITLTKRSNKVVWKRWLDVEWKNKISSPLPTLKRDHVLPIGLYVPWTKGMSSKKIGISSSPFIKNYNKRKQTYESGLHHSSSICSSYTRQRFAIHSTLSFVRNTKLFFGRVQYIDMVIVDFISCNIVSPPIC